MKKFRNMLLIYHKQTDTIFSIKLHNILSSGNTKCKIYNSGGIYGKYRYYLLIKRM